MDLKDFKKYMKHLPNCNLNQNWNEVWQALADIPEQFRGPEYDEYCQEINRKMSACNCGLEKLLNENGALPIPDVSQQREQLINFLKYCRNNGETWILEHEIEILVDDFLKIN